MQCEECRLPLWKSGEIVPAGTYARVDDQSYKVVRLDQEGPLPATLDGHIAWYCATARACLRLYGARQSNVGDLRYARSAYGRSFRSRSLEK
jgi:hypothetical protein